MADVADWVSLATKQPVWEPNQSIQQVYFPETAVISLVTLLDAGPIEAITIGNDGFVGLPVFHGPGETVTRAGCQMPGLSWRITTKEFVDLCSASPALHRALNRYSQLVIETISRVLRIWCTISISANIICKCLTGIAIDDPAPCCPLFSRRLPHKVI